MRTSSHPPSRDAWETLVRRTARTLVYPPTPDVADAVITQSAAGRARKRSLAWRYPIPRFRLLWAAGIVLAALVGLWAVPPARAAIREFLQIGVVRIGLVEPTPTPEAAPQPTSAMPHPFDLVGETTLEEAGAQAGFAIALPTYPSDIGPPDAVFYQEIGAPLVVLVWMSREEPGNALYSLQILGSDAIVTKVDPPVVEMTHVNGHEAAWTHGPYLLSYGREGAAEWRLSYLVSGRVLIWEVDGLTYRLESHLSLDEAVRMAESLEPWQE